MVDSLKKYVISFTLVIIFILLTIQVRWIIHSINFQEKVFQKTATLALNQTIAKITDNKPVCLTMRQCIKCDTVKLDVQLNSAGVWDKINEAIDAELKAYDINLAYKLDIIKSGSDTLKSVEKDIRKGNYYSQCLKDVILTTGYELVIRFEGKNKLLFQKAGLMFISSVILILIIILSIIYLLKLYHKELRLAENTKELINNISHEFKTPISSIALASNMIRKKRVKDNEKLQEYANLIFKENKKLQRQVESLLHLAAIERNEFDYNKQIVNVHSLIKDAISTIEIFLQERGCSVITILNAEQKNIFADKLHISNAIVNLLSNAIKYSAKNMEIVIRTSNIGNSVLIEVEDKGMGIPAKYLKDIFQKYYRVPTGDIHNIKGFGIGLSYVKMVAEGHSGEVKVESVYGKGSIFVLKLPIVNE